MQDHLKERLTGAAILVVVVVLLVPELFRGPPTTKTRPDIAANGGPPVRSYTIDLRDSAAAEPPGASVPAAAAAAGAAPNAPAVANPNPSTVATVQPSPPVAAAQPPAAAPVTPVAAPAAAPAAGAHTATAKTGWTVQVGSFARRDYAERMVKQVAGKGFTLEVAGPDDHGLYRVRSAPLGTRAAAQALKQKMQASGLKPIVNTTP